MTPMRNLVWLIHNNQTQDEINNITLNKIETTTTMACIKDMANVVRSKLIPNKIAINNLRIKNFIQNYITLCLNNSSPKSWHLWLGCSIDFIHYIYIERESVM